MLLVFFSFFFNDTPTTEIYTLSLHDALPIPRDWQHIVGHGQLQPANRTDPGPNWPWIPYLHRVQALCGEVVVDDSARFNDPAVAMVSVPAAWTAADTTPDYYGGGYRWALTQPAAGG